MIQILINVHLKQEILDPQGRAILGALNRFDLNEIVDVRQGKQFKLTLDRKMDSEVESKIRKVSETLLSNPIIEDFSIEVINDI